MTGPVLVTGGAGFIGSALVRFLIAETDEQRRQRRQAHVCGQSRVARAGQPAIRAIGFEHVDICDGVALRDVFARHQPRAVMHLAAESHVDRSIDRPSDFVATNLVGTATLLMVAQEYLHGLDAPQAREFRFAARIDGRGVRLARRRRRFHRVEPVSPAITLFGDEGRLGPSRRRLAQHVRVAADPHELLEQLRTVPVPGEADPAR